VQQLLAATDRAFEAADARSSPSQANRAAVRAGGAIRQWQARRFAAARPAAVAPVHRSRQRFWTGQVAAAAAVVLLAAGTIAIRYWPQQRQQANLPTPPDRDTRLFEMNAVSELAFGELPDDSASAAATTPAPAVDDGVAGVMPPTDTIASASGGEDQPYFDVPLSPDPEPTP